MTLLLIALCVAGAEAQTAPISLDDYRALLQSAQETLARSAGPLQESPPLPPVRLSAGDTVQPHPLFTADDGPEAATARLAAAIDQLDLSGGDNLPARMAQLESVASRLDLLQPSLMERFLRWLSDWWERLVGDWEPFGGSAMGQGALTALGWAGVIAALLLLIVLLSYWLRRLLNSLLAGAERARSADGIDNLPATATEARQQANELAQAGSYREAVRRLYLAALLRLAERELIRFDPSQTNREVLARVEQTAPARSHLEPVVETFDRVWYGEREPDEETFRSYSREIDALLQEPAETRL